METLQSAREQINIIDKEMAQLFEKRMEECAKIADYKKEHGLSIKDPAREEALIERNRSLVQKEELEPYYVQFLKSIMTLSVRYQSKRNQGARIAYCGTRGAYAYIASKRMFPDTSLTEFPDFLQAYRAVECGEFDSVVLPLENSSAGEVGDVMDMIFFGSLYINQVIDVPIHHALLACENASMQTITKVVSHPQALMQCKEYIRSHGFNAQNFSNTALAAEYVEELQDPSVAAIASDETAEEFGLKILDSGINDNKNNTTRFASLSLAQNRPAPSAKREDENFILVFTVPNEAGALAKALNIIGIHGFNMRNLRSRPMKNLPWSYYFYMEAEGSVGNENGQDMLRELSAVCAKLRLVGSYYTNTVLTGEKE